jgi:hypothetical protein
MTAAESRVDSIVNELMGKALAKERRIELLRELVERGEELPDDLLAAALRRLMERLTE